MSTERAARLRRRPGVLALIASTALLHGCSSGEEELTEPVGDPPVGYATASARPSAPGGPAEVDVLITYGGMEPSSQAVEVGGVVAGVVEDDGRCALVLSRPDHAGVRVEGDAVPDVTSTACGLLSVPVERLSSGEWTARLEYRSATSSGGSDELSVVVP